MPFIDWMRLNFFGFVMIFPLLFLSSIPNTAVSSRLIFSFGLHIAFDFLWVHILKRPPDLSTYYYSTQNAGSLLWHPLSLGPGCQRRLGRSAGPSSSAADWLTGCTAPRGPVESRIRMFHPPSIFRISVSDSQPLQFAMSPLPLPHGFPTVWRGATMTMSHIS